MFVEPRQMKARLGLRVVHVERDAGDHLLRDARPERLFRVGQDEGFGRLHHETRHRVAAVTLLEAPRLREEVPTPLRHVLGEFSIRGHHAHGLALLR
jgi:hypothetical protein